MRYNGGEPPLMIYTALRAVRKIDPSAFIIVTKTSEIMGKGFRAV